MRNDSAVLVAPALPQVNLLPGDVRQARTLGAVKRWLLVSAGVTAVAVGTVAGVAHLQGQSAASDLAQAEAEFASLQVEQGPFSQVTDVRAELERLRSARDFGVRQEILWSVHLGAVSAVTPPGVGIVTLDYQGATPLAAAPASTDPLIVSGLGTLSFTALAADLPDTAAWSDALETVPGLRDARVTAMNRADAGGRFRYEISGTIQVDERALAHRFDTQSEGDS
jgi:Tfp pilus assembly protein PilN